MNMKKTSYSYGVYFKEYLQKIAILLRYCWDIRDVIMPSTTHVSVIDYLLYMFHLSDYTEGQISYNNGNIFFYSDNIRLKFTETSRLMMLKHNLSFWNDEP